MAIFGIDCIPIEIEVDLHQGLPSFSVVGLGDTAVQESRERVRSAIKNSGYQFPMKKIVVSLAPADLKKSGPAFDLPIAIGILAASGQISLPENIGNSVFVGELGLDGDLRHVAGILAMAMEMEKIHQENFFIPKINAKEASLIKKISVFPAKHLNEILQHLSEKKRIKKFPKMDLENSLKIENLKVNFSSIVGQEKAKRALEITASGAHNILMNGSPGAGKTLMARALAGILPKMTREEIMEVTKIYSIAGLLPKNSSIINSRPFRVVHHTASAISIVGGGRNPNPGEISLAHRGVLFLDELPEFPGNVLEVLRQPLEDREITISRVFGSFTFPAHFTLVAAMNPCPCGFYGVLNSEKECSCSSLQISRYQKKISGPLLDRIDLHVDVSPVKFEKLTKFSNSENSKEISKRVQKVRDIQTARFKNLPMKTNSEMGIDEIKKFCEISSDIKQLLQQAMTQFNISARGFHRILKISRTIADLDNSNQIKISHVAEALQYRFKNIEN